MITCVSLIIKYFFPILRAMGAILVNEWSKTSELSELSERSERIERSE